MDSFITVLLLGLSVEGLVICPFFAFGMSLSERATGINFLCGRLLGIVIFGMVVSVLGNWIPIDKGVTNLVFGVFIMALGIYRLSRVIGDDSGPVEAVSGSVYTGSPTCRGGGEQGSGRGGGLCRGRGRVDKKVGFSLGLYRGFLNPGRKYLYLAPLLIGVGVVKGTAISFVYGLSSSVYLVIGFLSAGVINRLLPRKRLIAAAGGIVLITVGFLYAWKGKDLIL